MYRPHPEPVVLEIGALVVSADADLIDTPIELSPTVAEVDWTAAGDADR